MSCPPRRSRPAPAVALDAGLALLWRIAALAALVTVSLIFLWASGRFLFGMSAFPPASFPFSLAETWWIEVALASLGLSLTLSIPAILRTGEHVTIDILSPVLAPRVHRWIMRVGSLVLGLPVGWLLLTKVKVPNGSPKLVTEVYMSSVTSPLVWRWPSL